MTDASFQAAGCAVIIEDDPSQEGTATREAYAPIVYGSKTYIPSQIKKSIYAKKFLAIFSAFKEIGHIFYGATEPVIISDYHDTQQIGQRNLPNKNDSASPMECLQFRIEI